MGGWAEMGGIRKSAPFLHLRVFFCRAAHGRNGRNDDSWHRFRLHVCARDAIPCVQGAENAFPAFSERMTPSGTLYSRLVPDGPFC